MPHLSSPSQSSATATASLRRGPLSSPATDIIAHEDRYELRLALPGVRSEDIELSVERGLLAIEARDQVATPEPAQSLYREFGGQHYRRSFALNDELDDSAVSARLANGILTVTIPKRAEVKPRSITIESQSA